MDNNGINNINEDTISEDIDVVQQEPTKFQMKRPKQSLANKISNSAMSKKNKDVSPKKQNPIESKVQGNQNNTSVNNTSANVNNANINNPNINISAPNNTISNSVNSFKNGYKNNKGLSDRLSGLKGKNKQVPINNSDDSYKETSAVKDKAEEAKEKIKAAKDKVENKIAGKAIQAATGGAISAKNAEKLAAKAKVLMNKQAKIRAYIAIGVSIGLVLIIIVTSILMNNDDESLTSLRTNDYLLDESTDEELIDYMGFIAICPSVAEARAYAEEYGVELEDGKVTFGTMRELSAIEEVKVSPTCLNAIDYYESFKKEYVENKKACYRNRDPHNEQLPNYYRHYENLNAYAAFIKNQKSKDYFIGHKDDYDCQIILPTTLIFETMSYDLTDQDLFNKEYLDRYDPYKVDLRKLANALSEYVQETCYKWMYKDRITGEIHSSPCGNCDKVKVPHDGFYFQISFNKYVCYLKYGDSCAHPNYSGKPRQKFPDLKYLEHLCGSPSNDKLEKLEHPETEEIEEDENNDIPVDEPAPDQPIQDGDGNSVVNFALQFVGNPYVWGGTSLTDGIDCSGFVMKVYEHFGVTGIPHSSVAQRSIGKSVSSLSEAKSGDVLCFQGSDGGHVGIYIGNGQMVHAAGARSGIKVSGIGNRKLVAIRRVVE